jgi:hypothetical protein
METAPTRCPDCDDGSPVRNGRCPKCMGSGFVAEVVAEDLVCPACSGTGLCATCEGSGVVPPPPRQKKSIQTLF